MALKDEIVPHGLPSCELEKRLFSEGLSGRPLVHSKEKRPFDLGSG
jgi:hypothetical protein